ncbi:uncharacterized protein ASPGLDRAFT_317912 [Aspergillus glaucus CBS 516.65]|uniref:Uncharacterized protein n=1 Tax=Aspergillus glaucus CBS 516.65 TaxID=1160497 RepID=A0A1L9VK64_ASPGL|nr:hypothetical protein ASPGLDRAFT_317912 [Aspergillus glaucus CBS 516.65]OJJ84303.1 hypothetical protein ASPGLDRAFT_317912 [Aspergillus glaucus CBS 516.65]
MVASPIEHHPDVVAWGAKRQSNDALVSKEFGFWTPPPSETRYVSADQSNRVTTVEAISTYLGLKPQRCRSPQFSIRDTIMYIGRSKQRYPVSSVSMSKLTLHLLRYMLLWRVSRLMSGSLVDF